MKFAHTDGPTLALEELVGTCDLLFTDTSFFFPFADDLNPKFRRYHNDNVLGMVKHARWERLKSGVIHASLNDLERKNRLVGQEPKMVTVEQVGRELKKIHGAYRESLGQMPHKRKYDGMRHLLQTYADVLQDTQSLMSTPQKVVPSHPDVDRLTQLLFQLRRYYLGGARKRMHGETTDEHLFAQALYAAHFMDKQCAVLTQDNDLKEILAKAKYVFMNGESRAPFASRLHEPRFSICYPRGRRFSPVRFTDVPEIPIPDEELQRQRGPLTATYGAYPQEPSKNSLISAR